MAATIDGYTLVEAQTALADWKAALTGLSTSQSYTIGTRILTRVNLAEARNTVRYFANIVSQFQGGGGVRVIRAVPRDC